MLSTLRQYPSWALIPRQHCNFQLVYQDIFIWCLKIALNIPFDWYHPIIFEGLKNIPTASTIESFSKPSSSTSFWPDHGLDTISLSYQLRPHFSSSQLKDNYHCTRHFHWCCTMIFRSLRVSTVLGVMWGEISNVCKKLVSGRRRVHQCLFQLVYVPLIFVGGACRRIRSTYHSLGAVKQISHHPCLC